MAERVAAGPEDQTNIGIGDLLAVVVDALSRIEQHVVEAVGIGNRNLDRVVAGIDATQRGMLGGQRTAIGVVIAQPEAAARQPDLAQHGGQRHQHPVRLLAMVLALDCPAAHQHGATLGHAARQLANIVSRHRGDLFRPFRGFRLLVLLAQEIRQELLEADRVSVDELFVVELFGIERMGQRQHQRGIAVGAR